MGGTTAPLGFEVAGETIATRRGVDDRGDQLVVAAATIGDAQQLGTGDIPVEEGRRVGRSLDGNAKRVLGGIQRLRVRQTGLLSERECAGRGDVNDHDWSGRIDTRRTGVKLAREWPGDPLAVDGIPERPAAYGDGERPAVAGTRDLHLRRAEVVGGGTPDLRPIPIEDRHPAASQIHSGQRGDKNIDRLPGTARSGCSGDSLTGTGGDDGTRGQRCSGRRERRHQQGQTDRGQRERTDGTGRQETRYPVTGRGREATVTRLLNAAIVPDGVDAVVVMIQVPLLRRMVQA